MREKGGDRIILCTESLLCIEETEKKEKKCGKVEEKGLKGRVWEE